MICEDNGFIQGFLAAMDLFDDNHLLKNERISSQECSEDSAKMPGSRPFPERYLEIPTFIRQGKTILS